MLPSLGQSGTIMVQIIKKKVREMYSQDPKVLRKKLNCFQPLLMLQRGISMSCSSLRLTHAAWRIEWGAWSGRRQRISPWNPLFCLVSTHSSEAQYWSCCQYWLGWNSNIYDLGGGIRGKEEEDWQCVRDRELEKGLRWTQPSNQRAQIERKLRKEKGESETNNSRRNRHKRENTLIKAHTSYPR